MNLKPRDKIITIKDYPLNQGICHHCRQKIPIRHIKKGTILNVVDIVDLRNNREAKWWGEYEIKLSNYESISNYIFDEYFKRCKK